YGHRRGSVLGLSTGKSYDFHVTTGKRYGPSKPSWSECSSESSSQLTRVLELSAAYLLRYPYSSTEMQVLGLAYHFADVRNACWSKSQNTACVASCLAYFAQIKMLNVHWIIYRCHTHRTRTVMENAQMAGVLVADWADTRSPKVVDVGGGDPVVNT
ncbi:hypothetical protein P153DRAFT_402553, partial [Dothidotthia symphoricarpi CBS 119687]